MQILRLALIGSILLIGHSVAFASPAHISKAPAWVKPLQVKASKTIPGKGVNDGTYYLLLSKQIKLTNNTIQYHFTLAKQITNALGTEHNAKVLIPYDASLESLTINSIEIIRNGHSINQLTHNPIHLIQAENDLRNNIYDNVKTAVIILKDIEVGDVIKYSYTLTSHSNWLNKSFSTKFVLAHSIPIKRIYESLSVPSQMPLHIKYFKTTIKPQITHSKKNTQYVWSISNPPIITLNNHMPSWYIPFPLVQLSRLNSWKQVVAQFSPLFQIPKVVAPDLSTTINTIKTQNANPIDRLEKVLKLIQNHIRYTGLEIGFNNVKPTTPSTVFKRGYGDCKDKAFLMVTMLRKMGIVAHIALVNSELRQTIHYLLPATSVFDHAIVVANINDVNYWLDPTRAYQASNIAHTYIPNYQYALVLSKNTKALTKIQAAHLDQSYIDITEIYDLRSGFQKPAKYKVMTTCSGQFADYDRYKFARLGVETIGDLYARPLRKFYPGLEKNKALALHDDQVNNRFRVTEYYTINNFWSLDTKSKFYNAAIYQYNLHGLLRSIYNKQRKIPLHIAYPLSFHAKVKILLPREWEVKPTEKKLNNAIFNFKKFIRC